MRPKTIIKEKFWQLLLWVILLFFFFSQGDNSKFQKQPPEVFRKNRCSENFCKFHKTLYEKETPTHVLSCEIKEIFKSIYFEEHLRTTASEVSNSKWMDSTPFVFIFHINPFHANVPFLCPLKTSENLWFSDVFRGYRNGTLAWKGLIRQRVNIR